MEPTEPTEESEKKLEGFEFFDQEFFQQTVRLDFNSFTNCSFDECEVLYDGVGGLTSLNCSFRDSIFRLGGPAKNTLNFLRMVNHFAPDLVDGYIAYIKGDLGPGLHWTGPNP